VSNKTLFLDFDGVIRIWRSAKVSAAEAKCYLEPGTLFSCAFSHKYLTPAVTGEITHLEWHQRVGNELVRKYGASVAACLLDAWNAEGWDIDRQLLDSLIRVCPGYQLVLVTNATNKLNEDLMRAGLGEAFRHVINSAEIGFAKPDPEFFRIALATSNAIAEETVFIDDSSKNVVSAQEVGIKSVLHKCMDDTVCRLEGMCA